MKKLICLIVTGIMIGLAGAAHATQVTYPMSTILPAATDTMITAYPVTSVGNNWGSAVTVFNFGLMAFQHGVYQGKPWQFWAPDHYYAIEIGVIGGAGTPNTITVKYNDGTHPNVGGHGLSHKAAISFSKQTSSTVGVPITPGTLNASCVKMNDIANTTSIASSLVQGGWLRMYVGIFSPADPNAPTPLDACTQNMATSGIETFQNTDASGTYNGSLIVTATL